MLEPKPAIPVAFCLGWFLAERVIGANVDMWE